MTDASSSPSPENRAVGLWLVLCGLMVFTMMLIGAITRLTESGLSMVEWRPLIGWIPPLAEAEWQRVFALYRDTSEFQLANPNMTLAEFKTIFWWEYIHRLWGRLIGLVFALPLFWFWRRRMIPEGYGRHLFILLLLGGVQGFIGWWMVKSGLVARVDVSQYRLMVHLGMAFLILGYLAWLAIGLLWPVEAGRPSAPRAFRRLGALAHVVIFVTILAGALVAGLNAGFMYNDWPLMDGDFVPFAYWMESPWWLNWFETIPAVQFNHRILAYGVVAVVGLLWLWGRRVDLHPRARLSIDCLALTVVAQILLGITTLLLVVPIPLAVLHQGGAAACFVLSLWVMKELRGDRTPQPGRDGEAVA